MKKKRGKRTQPSSPNFLTCPGVPALEEGSSVSSSGIKDSRGSSGTRAHTRVSDESIRRPPSHPARLERASGQTPLSPKLPERGASPRRAPAKRIRYARWIIVTTILVFIILTAFPLIALVRAGSYALASKAAVEHMIGALGEERYQEASGALERATEHAQAAHEALHGVGFWRDVPTIGTQIRALEDATAAGVQTLEGVRGVFNVALGLLDVAWQAESAAGKLDVPVDASRSFEDYSKEERRAILGRLYRSLPDLRVAQAKVDVALETWNRIPQSELIAPIKSAFQPITETLPRMKRTLDEAIPLLEVLIPLAGYPEPSNYLVILQNTDEIRGSGGFIGTVGTLQVDSGAINQERFAFHDVYNIDVPASKNWYEEPPAPMREHMNIRNLFLRDANWSPDFPTSAEKLLDFYVREKQVGTGVHPPVPDGLIAVNPPLFADLLRIVGPVTVDGVTFEHRTFFDVLEYEVEINYKSKGIPSTERKAIVSKLGREIMDRLMKLPASKWPDLLDVLTRALERKQVQVYAKDPSLLARLDAYGWTGRVRETRGDYLMVIDSNLAAFKTDAVMDKEIFYSIDATDSKDVIATVTLRYVNNAPGFAPPDDPINYKYTRYRSYTRVYVPEGSELIRSRGAMLDDTHDGGRTDVYRALGKTVFGAFWTVNPQGSRELSFTYRIPASVSDALIQGDAYVLDWQKQSGNDTATLTLDLEFGTKLRDASPPEEREEWGDARYRLTTYSLTDQTFTVEF